MHVYTQWVQVYILILKLYVIHVRECVHVCKDSRLLEESVLEYACTHVYIHTYIFNITYTEKHMYSHADTNTHIHMCIRAHPYTHACTEVH